MPTPTKGPRLGGGPAHERLMLANLATSLFEHDRITTTEAKAKRLRPLAERLITFAKRGDLHARRRVLSVISDKGVVHRLFTEIAPDMAERPGGYTRITKIGARKGDNAPMAVIELVREPLAKKATVKEAEAATKRAAKKSEAPRAAEETPAAEETEVEATESTETTEANPAGAAERIVSISPSATEVLFAIGAGDQVVAVDDNSNFPPEAPMTDLSSFEPNVEAIAAHDPDLVVAASDTPDLVDGLEALDIDVLVHLAPTDVEGVYEQIADLGHIAGVGLCADPSIDGVVDQQLKSVVFDCPLGDLEVFGIE